MPFLEKPEACAGCALYDKGTGFTNPEGHGALGVLIVGEAAGENEVRDGLPFRPFAQAGSLLERVIKISGFDRMQFRIANMCQCRPPRDYLENAPWELGAVSHCKVHRDRVVNEMRPKAIWALGAIPTRYLTGLSGKKRGISYLRGYVLPSLDYRRDDGPIPIVPSFHPSYIRRGKQSLINVMMADLRKVVAIATDKFNNYCLFPDDDAARFVTYITQPNLDDARSYYLRCKENQGAIISFDIETDESKFKDEDEDEEIETEIQAGAITQIQFSVAAREAIAFPFAGEFKRIAADILSLPNVKAGHNAWRFDLPILRREHIKVAGLVHDTRWMWHHLQPDLPAHLQFCGSFYGMPFPWKHLADFDEPFYGCADADVLSRMMAQLPQQLESKGIWRGYERHVVGREPILINMTRRGIPVDDTARQEFGERLTREQERVRAEVIPQWPKELISYYPVNGYVRPPADKTGLIQREFPDLKASGQGELMPCTAIRWCRPIGFNPGSRDQVIVYLKHFKLPVPKKHKSDKDTTEELELLKLVRRLQRLKRTRHHAEFLEKVLEYREYQKMKGTYVDGWIPDANGFVHPTYQQNTPVGQLTSKNPSGQTFPKRSDLGKEMRRMVAAKPKHKLVEIDYSSFHAVTLAFESQSVNWLRLARSDIHSFTTAHFLHLPEREKLLGLPDDELVERLAWIKQHHTDVRNNKAKHAILGVGNGLSYKSLYRRYSEYFDGEKEAKTLLDTIQGVFPEVFRYQNRRRREAHEKTYLVSKWGYIRWFFDVMHWDSRKQDLVHGDDSEAALCFHHVQDAFGHKNEQMLWMRANGHDERFGFCNDIHDSFIFHCEDALVDECLHTMHNQMTRRSPVLIDPVTAPNGLWVDVEASVGCDWAHMEKIKLGKPQGLMPDEQGLATLAEARYESVEPAPQLEEVPF
jgi:uracil-DNA glycosylase family 4